MRILWVKTSPLHPLTRGGDLRTYHLLKCLSPRHDICFAGMIGSKDQEVGSRESASYCREARWVRHDLPQGASRQFYLGAILNIVTSPQPYAVSRFASEALRECVRRWLVEQKFDLLVSDFLFPAASLPWELHHCCDSPPWVLFQHNVESMIWERRAFSKGLTTWYWRQQADRMRRFEAEACARFDGVLTVSESDTQTHREKFGLSNVLGHIPTGVDAAFFQSIPRLLAAQPTIVFVGSMDWHANVDAVLFFAQEVWPQVRAALPEAVFRIVGRQPPAAVVALADNADGIVVTGTVPDVRPELRSAHATIVPLRIGGGTRLKIYEAMAAGVPVVSTHVGAEGLPLEHGRHALLADSPEAMAAALVRLCTDRTFAEQMAEHALKEVVGPNTWESAAQQFERHCLGLLRA